VHTRYASATVIALLLTGPAVTGWRQATAPGPAAPPAKGTSHPELPDTQAETCAVCHDGVTKGEVVHGPAGAGMCDTCHQFSGKGDDTVVQLAEKAKKDDTAPLCATCHAEVAALAKGDHGHGPAAGGDCLACHAAHAAENANLLKGKGPAACASCHSDVVDELKLSTKHAPAVADCALCHEPHGAPVAKYLREDINSLCLACHIAADQDMPDPARPKLFGRELPDGLAAMTSPAKRVLLDPLRRRGHPTGNHPVRGPKDPLDEKRAFTCVSCHKPHGSATPSLKRFAATPTEFCVECHR
jgi:predicted CXXCH cytochrome family protein